MWVRALSIVGASVLLVAAGNAGAIEFNVKRFVVIDAFSRMTDEQALLYLRNADLKVSTGVDVNAGPYSRTVKFNSNASAWQAMTLKFPNSNVTLWKKWDQDHKDRANPAYSGPDFVEDGPCYLLPKAELTATFVNKSDTQLLKVMMMSRAKPADYGLMYAIQVVEGPNVVSIGSSSYDINSRSGALAQFKTKCLQTPTKITDWAYATWNDILIGGQPAWLGNTLRGAAVEYYTREEYPDYSGIEIIGYTESDLLAACTTVSCPGYTPPPAGGETPPPTSGTTTPACTKPDGTTSGNPYDCAPTDNQTKCSLIDIPCNLKSLFIPRKDFLSQKLKDGIGLTVKFPLTVSDSWMTDITFGGKTFPVGADFSTLTWNEETKDQFRFFAWWSTFLFLLGYLGVPFLNGKRGMAESAKDSTVGAAAREAAENDRINADYQRLRADDSWKNP